MSRATTMVARVETYLHTRRQFGFQLRVEGGELLRFARYADGSGHRGAVTSDLALRWAQDATAATPLYRARRLEIVRCFAKYQVAFEPTTEVPAVGILGPAHRRTPPYIFSPREIGQLRHRRKPPLLAPRTARQDLRVPHRLTRVYGPPDLRSASARARGRRPGGWRALDPADQVL